eukprot:1161685-Pelagomonas_calceolata.AAC.13
MAFLHYDLLTCKAIFSIRPPDMHSIVQEELLEILDGNYVTSHHSEQLSKGAGWRPPLQHLEIKAG